MGNDGFYEELPLFKDFNGIIDDRYFKPVPEDWKIIVADIQGSTRAIEEGRYKDVNTLGAAAIAAAQNALDRREFPYVFGGDGATLVVSPQDFNKVAAALDGVRDTARRAFDMNLRVGAVDLAEILQMGCRLEVARYELCAGKAIAIFRGGALSAADKIVKGDYEKYAVPERDPHVSDLSGLSCRWKPIPSEKGRILSLLVEARVEDKKSVYRRVLDRIEKILGGDVAGANPVHLSTMGYKSVWENIQTERRYHDSAISLPFLSRAIEILLSVLIFKWKIPPLIFDSKHYAEAMKNHSDFRKFDDLLRMVIDCTETQIHAIAAFLEEMHARGEVCYGMHTSPAALMTCFVYDTREGGHVHFIDGGDGGYAMAAKQFKAQVKD